MTAKQRPPAGARTYHVVRFAHADEAAAFVAALSRYLDSPRGAPRPGAHADAAVELWSCPAAAADGSVELFLSDGALAATTAGFAAPAVAGMRRGDELTDGCALLIGA